MTNTEFCNLKKLMLAGCIAERVELIDGMPPHQLAEFTERLELPGGMAALNEATWRHIAGVLAIHLSDALWPIGKAPCADQSTEWLWKTSHERAKECRAKEMKTAAGGDLTAAEASIINGSNLQETM